MTQGTCVRLFDVTMSCDTSAYGSGDLIADTQVLSGFFNDVDKTATILAVTIIDEDDQGVALDVHFLQDNVTMGTENSAPTISDANARNSLGFVPFATTDYKDIGGVRIGCVRNVWLPVKAKVGTADLYVAIVNGSGTPTFTASGLKLRIAATLD